MEAGLVYLPTAGGCQAAAAGGQAPPPQLPTENPLSNAGSSAAPPQGPGGEGQSPGRGLPLPRGRGLAGPGGGCCRGEPGAEARGAGGRAVNPGLLPDSPGSRRLHSRSREPPPQQQETPPCPRKQKGAEGARLRAAARPRGGSLVPQGGRDRPRSPPSPQGGHGHPRSPLSSQGGHDRPRPALLLPRRIRPPLARAFSSGRAQPSRPRLSRQGGHNHPIPHFVLREGMTTLSPCFSFREGTSTLIPHFLCGEGTTTSARAVPTECTTTPSRLIPLREGMNSLIPCLLLREGKTTPQPMLSPEGRHDHHHPQPGSWDGGGGWRRETPGLSLRRVPGLRTAAGSPLPQPAEVKHPNHGAPPGDLPSISAWPRQEQRQNRPLTDGM